MTFDFGISSALDYNLSFSVQTLLDGTANNNDLEVVGNGTVTITAGSTHGSFSGSDLDEREVA